MSIDVALADLPAAVAARRARPYLVSVRGDRPHVVSVTVGLRDGVLVVGAGRRTAANLAGNPSVTLLWPLDEDDPHHTLLVDGTAAADPEGETLAITPTSAVLHRARARGSGADPGAG